MAAEAQTLHPTGEAHIASLASARSSGEVVQLPDGRAGYCSGLNARIAGDAAAMMTAGVVSLLKSTSVIFLPGQEVWWDASNNVATYSVAGSFFVGMCAENDTVAAATTTVKVDLNRRTNCLIDQNLGAGFELRTILTAGTPVAVQQGGHIKLAFSATAEAQLAEALGIETMAVGNDGIFEFEYSVVDNGDDAALDLNLGIANAGHDTDADAITESVFLHLDGNTLDLDAESDDGTTEVAATDTTVNLVESAWNHVMIDTRTPTDVQIYHNGALMLTGTAFAVGAATGPWKFLFHMEKTSNDTPGHVRIRNARAWRALAV